MTLEQLLEILVETLGEGEQSARYVEGMKKAEVEMADKINAMGRNIWDFGTVFVYTDEDGKPIVRLIRGAVKEDKFRN